jgi:hypothetical protein
MELGKFFEKYGDVRTVKILENKEGEALGSGYVRRGGPQSRWKYPQGKENQCRQS